MVEANPGKPLNAKAIAAKVGPDFNKFYRRSLLMGLQEAS